ncbi:CBL-interacting protein kinase 31 [Tritrichomonas foetus]|uniref:CBL-interacting protein kinase 31 n=1 Tax=Tritrichomonas foetus TaxID=1144522 RepID=A0A1J4JL41_9EUKA|nr:CBL-interacting protein kinase 31 [Tritrichomonas foetus]|eukprot:OHS98277.1 CBL-interacting protein kinase 31 [Tritrichomonas foetus]
MCARELTNVGPYKLYDVIGEGASSVVRLARIDKDNNVYACKIIPKNIFKDKDLARRFQLEIRINHQLYHPNIVRIHDIFNEKKFYFIIMEYCPHGSLLDEVMRTKNKRLDEEDARFYMRQVFNALQFMHSLGICHRDLKPDNILLGENKQVKLSDFGLSRFVGKDGLTKTPVGSPCYASPECYSGMPYDARKSDIWSTGVILYTILAGNVPWKGETKKHIETKIKTANYAFPPFFSKEVKVLINSILCVSLKTRATIEQILNCQWFQQDKNIYSFKKSKPSKVLTLKKLDLFFGKDYKSGIHKDFREEDFKNLKSNMSTTNLIGFDDLIKTLKVEIPIRVKTNENQNDSTTNNEEILEKINTDFYKKLEEKQEELNRKQHHNHDENTKSPKKDKKKKKKRSEKEVHSDGSFDSDHVSDVITRDVNINNETTDKKKSHKHKHHKHHHKAFTLRDPRITEAASKRANSMTIQKLRKCAFDE